MMRALSGIGLAGVFLRVWALLAVLVVASGCAQQNWASDAAIEAARYQHGGTPELTLVTIVHYDTGRGDHTALFINGSERVVFDPAGSWTLDTIPVRNDVHFGMTPVAGASFFVSHVRDTHYAVVQRLAVSPEVAERAIELALQVGPVAPARCASATSSVLRRLSPTQDLRGSVFPQVLMREFGEIPGVQTYELHRDSPDFETDMFRLQQSL